MMKTTLTEDKMEEITVDNVSVREVMADGSLGCEQIESDNLDNWYEHVNES